ncbi:adenosylcobalamin-dependent ribonucleoside-diphosphate reductase [Robertkochia solimangrovi]|uniref:adenosylcobalamin-dependent ribonucleoside-diphosphate reductase n=1 Tax=Robertkochia solimangrovi TaxID=2213046 RepID=UPI00117EC27F|nr:adenosylcobalamin-dependent ribonucleoside-diphosphate reductase [Robertkochia solimangrovi]TRZ40982.1 adenosylcobalamin-dependent ribonucleoside-diphosphate reductase [Robertkochia solimangrovi]
MGKFTDNAMEILRERYLLKNESGSVTESPTQLFKRVARCIASAESENRLHWEEKFYNLMSARYFLPNSPTLMNSGLEKGQLSACFVLPVNDSLESIFTTLKNTALIHQSGGGTGFNFSDLRPANDLVSNRSGTSSGPLAFMKLFDAATEYVKQGGRRRGANMGILNVNHPDIREFITLKSEAGVLQNFNLSVGMTDDFMKALKGNGIWNLINPRNGEIMSEESAHKIWDLIIDQAWQTGDPGMVFLDSINADNPIPAQGRILSTNPCGEVPLLNYESCNLGSVNLSLITRSKGDVVHIDWQRLEEIITLAVRFLDNVITVNHYVIPEIKDITRRNRKIGLGVMGWAELLIQLEIPYASIQAVSLAEDLMRFIQERSLNASRELAVERGVFPGWKDSTYAGKMPLRNATVNSIAPTGSISVLANTSYSIEPLYAVAFNRSGILGDRTQTEINHLFIKKMNKVGRWNSRIYEELLSGKSIKDIPDIPDSFIKVFQTAQEIPWEFHLKHQQAFQRYTDNAVSKTINLPTNSSPADISNIYLTAWEYGLKGITIYREGSKSGQVLRKCSLGLNQTC